jgi:hypothetical protein
MSSTGYGGINPVARSVRFFPFGLLGSINPFAWSVDGFGDIKFMP